MAHIKKFNENIDIPNIPERNNVSDKLRDLGDMISSFADDFDEKRPNDSGAEEREFKMFNEIKSKFSDVSSELNKYAHLKMIEKDTPHPGTYRRYWNRQAGLSHYE
tara:strand:- start:17695 stop:18012 length:318 start_codon:yes stop_codon:yes gene_type:complete